MDKPGSMLWPMREEEQRALDELPGLEAACIEGQLDKVHELNTLWMKEHQPNAYSGIVLKPWMDGAMRRAIEHDKAPIVSYFLHNGEKMCPLKKWTGLNVQLAVRARATAVLETFLWYGWEINEPTSRIYPSALRFAINDTEMTAWLLDHKASPNARSSVGITPLSMACSRGDFDVIKMMFDRGGSVRHGQLLHWAARRRFPDQIEVMAFLLDQGAPINAIEFEEDPDIYLEESFRGLATPLHHAAKAGQVSMVKFLLSRGADPSIKDSYEHGNTAKDWVLRRLDAMHAQSLQTSNSKSSYDFPPEEDLREILRLLEPSGWSAWWAPWAAGNPFRKRQFTDGKRFFCR